MALAVEASRRLCRLHLASQCPAYRLRSCAVPADLAALTGPFFYRVPRGISERRRLSQQLRRCISCSESTVVSWGPNRD